MLEQRAERLAARPGTAAAARSPSGRVPPEIFAAALQTFLSGRRLDMSVLAAELGVSRATLYRRVPSRTVVLGEVVWWLTERTLERALLAGAGRCGAERVLAVADALLREVHDRSALRAFLVNEPECALRVLTSKHGPVQGGLCAAVENLLLAEERNGSLRLTLPADVLAYVIVRIGETFLYADVIADRTAKPDLGLATEVIARLLCLQGPLSEPAHPKGPR